MDYGDIAVGSVPTSIISSDSNRVGIIFQNNGNKTVYIGDSSVGSLTGYPIEVADIFTLERNSTVDAFYTIAESGAGSLTYQTVN